MKTQLFRGVVVMLAAAFFCFGPAFIFWPGPDSVWAANTTGNSSVLVSALGPEEGAGSTSAPSSGQVSTQELESLIQDSRDQRQASLELARKVQEQVQRTQAAAKAIEEAELEARRAELDAQAYAARVIELEGEVAARPDNQRLADELARFRDVSAQAQARVGETAALVRQAKLEHELQQQAEESLRRDLAIQREIETAARKNLADFLERARAAGLELPANMERDGAALVGLTGENANSRAAFLAHRDKIRNFNNLVAGMKESSLEDGDLDNVMGLLGREIIGLDLEKAIAERKAIERATAFLLDGLRAGLPQTDDSLLLYLPDYQGPAAMDFWATYNSAQNMVMVKGEYYVVASLDTKPPVDWKSDFYRFSSPRRYWVDPREYDPATGNTRAVSYYWDDGGYALAGLIIIRPMVFEKRVSYKHYNDNCIKHGMVCAYCD
ncbi:MAG: hypothetical protein QMD09_02595 [Desulfatibacillaceae bacterium]|nr:hypothetical protein [Desulfatibacillaceae bacterium]